jgi:hypothetical protein
VETPLAAEFIGFGAALSLVEVGCLSGRYTGIARGVGGTFAGPPEIGLDVEAGCAAAAEVEGCLASV